MWSDLPRKHPPSPQFMIVFVSGAMPVFSSKYVIPLLEILVENGMNITITYIDATFVRGCLGDDKIGRTKCGKGSKIMTIVDEESRPLAAIVTSAMN